MAGFRTMQHADREADRRGEGEPAFEPARDVPPARRTAGEHLMSGEASTDPFGIGREPTRSHVAVPQPPLLTIVLLWVSPTREGGPVKRSVPCPLRQSGANVHEYTPVVPLSEATKVIVSV